MVTQSVTPYSLCFETYISINERISSRICFHLFFLFLQFFFFFFYRALNMLMSLNSSEEIILLDLYSGSTLLSLCQVTSKYVEKFEAKKVEITSARGRSTPKYLISFFFFRPYHTPFNHLQFHF